jgi:SNF2 family DNA or RNA helicase
MQPSSTIPQGERLRGFQTVREIITFAGNAGGSIEEGDRALIFTQFAEWGKLLQPYLEKQLGGETLFLYGATKKTATRGDG